MTAELILKNRDKCIRSVELNLPAAFMSRSAGSYRCLQSFGRDAMIRSSEATPSKRSRA